MNVGSTKLKAGKVVDIVTELAKHPEGTFIDLLPFNGFQFAAVTISGDSPVWEMHPDTDEFFYVLKGKITMRVLLSADEKTHVVTPGQMLVVPKQCWHKISTSEGTQFLYLTPGLTEHSEAEDPRA